MDIALISRLADQGVLGILLAISVVANFYSFKMLLAEKDKRREDAVAVTAGIVSPLKEIRDSVTTLVDAAITNSDRRGKR